MIRPETSGGMMGLMRMVMDSIVVPLPREEVVAMPGRVMGLLRDRFSALQADLPREHQARTTAREEAFVPVVVVEVGAAGDFTARPLPGLFFLRLLRRSLSLHLLSFRHRLWRW